MIEPRIVPTTASCAACGLEMSGRFGWCTLCCEAYCFTCGRSHLCTTICEQGGCAAGYCVRLAIDGHLSRTWGLPADG